MFRFNKSIIFEKCYSLLKASHSLRSIPFGRITNSVRLSPPFKLSEANSTDKKVPLVGEANGSFSFLLDILLKFRF